MGARGFKRWIKAKISAGTPQQLEFSSGCGREFRQTERLHSEIKNKNFFSGSHESN
jgi:hypothetical protein